MGGYGQLPLIKISKLFFCTFATFLGLWPVVGVLFGRWSLVGAPFGQWLMMNFWFGRCFFWSVRAVFSVPFGQCFTFLLFGGQFLFSRIVGGCVNQYMVIGWWSVVNGWSWMVVLYYAVILCQELLWLYWLFIHNIGMRLITGHLHLCPTNDICWRIVLSKLG